MLGEVKMLEPATVSAIIPVYNRLGVVATAIDSVLAQTWPCSEVLIVDDGSNDGTGEYLRGRAAGDDRIRVLQQSNQGSAAARNLGIRSASGELIAFLDSDDVWYPDYVDSQLSAVGDADLVLADGWCQEPDGTMRRLSSYPNWVLPDSVDALAQGAWMLPSFSLVRRQIAERLLFDSSVWICDDTDFLFRFILSGGRVVGNPLPIAEYRSACRGAQDVAEQLTSDDANTLLATYEVWIKYLGAIPHLLDRTPLFHKEMALLLAGRDRLEEAEWHRDCAVGVNTKSHPRAAVS